MIREIKTKVLQNRKITDEVYSIWIKVPKDFKFLSGQYISVSVMENGKKIRRPYSIASNPKIKNKIELCVKKIETGLASKYLCSLKKGDNIEIFGPMGKFTLGKSSVKKDIIFIAAGTGISPLKSMIEFSLAEGNRNRIILLKSTRSENQTIYDKEFQALKKKHKNFEFHNILSQPKNPNFENKGYLQDFLEKYIPEKFKGEIYICGLKNMINAVEEKLMEIGIGEEQIFYEKYD